VLTFSNILLALVLRKVRAASPRRLCSGTVSAPPVTGLGQAGKRKTVCCAALCSALTRGRRAQLGLTLDQLDTLQQAKVVEGSEAAVAEVEEKKAL